MFLPKRSSKKGKSNKDKIDINQKVIQLIQEAVRNDPKKEMISFFGDEMEKSHEHELKLFQLMLGNRANSDMPPSSSMDTGFYPSMPSSLGAQQTTKERMSEGSYGNPFLYGNGKYQTL